MAIIPKHSTRRLIGVVSDTHGLVRPDILRLLRGVEMIIHAGDVGKPEVLDALREIAPVAAVRGNVDRGVWAQGLPVTEVAEVGEALIYVLHDLNELDLDPAAAGFHAVISGHSHKPVIHERQGVLYLNPGSAGPRRFRLPVSMALLSIEGKSLQAQIVEIPG